MKKVLSILLTLMILLSAFAVLTASAEETGAWEIDVPQVRIVTDDGNGLQLKKADGYVSATMTVTDTNGNPVGGAGEVKIRGNSTMNLEKKSYTFKFTKKQDILGMGKAKKWALAANMFDPTLLRNYTAVDTARELGLEYTSEKQIVELWVDGSFRGCYLLIEPIEEGKTRVDIDIESNDGKNDFIIEREYNHVDEGVTYFRSNNVRFACKEPDEPNEEQLAYIQSTVDEVFDALKSGDRETIEKKIDIDSFAKYYLLNEFTKTVDFDYSSVFFYYRDGKLYAGPAWDYDLAMGNQDINASSNYAAANQTDDLYCTAKHFYNWLCRCEWFFDAVRQIYLEHSDYLNNIGAENGLIDTLYNTHKAAIDRNFQVAGWHTYAYYTNFNKRPSSVYTENLAYFKSWCSARAAWLNGYFTEDVAECVVGDSNGSGELDILDATFIQRELVGLATQSDLLLESDADCDGEVCILDATRVQRKLADLHAPYAGESIWVKAS